MCNDRNCWISTAYQIMGFSCKLFPENFKFVFAAYLQKAIFKQYFFHNCELGLLWTQNECDCFTLL